MRALPLTLAISGLAIALCGQAFPAVDLLNGSAQQSELRIGLYHPTGVGSMDLVREFDGRVLSFGSIEDLSALGYSGPWQYSVVGRYLFAHDQDAAVDLNYMNHFGVTFDTTTLTHRLGAVRVGDISLVGSPDGVDDSPTQDFSVVRTVNDIEARYSPDSNQVLRLVAGTWQQNKSGTSQQQGRWNSGSGNRKHVIALPLHSQTGEGTVGADLRLGQAAVVNYRYTNTKYGEGGSGITTVPLLQSLTQIDSDMRASTIKARATINKRLFLTGSQITRKRVNTRASFVESHPAGMTTNSINTALTYLATDSLSVTARYRTLDQTSSIIPMISGGEVRNNALSTKLKSSLFEATYSGIPHAFLKAGYERRDIARSTQFTTERWAEMEQSSKANITTGSIRYYPTADFSLSANAWITSADTAGYAGTPNEREQYNVNATYMVRNNLAFYGDFSSIDERNNLIRVPYTDIPLTATNAAEEKLRKEAAGQGYKNKMTTNTIGTWYALGSRLVVDANYAKIETDAVNLWILGESSSASNQPNTAPNMVPYITQNNQWSTGLTYALTPKLSLYGRYIQSKSGGRALLDSALYPAGVGPVWTPVDVREHTYVVGFAKDLSAKDRLSLDLSVSEYVDFLNSANTGTFSIWRAAWSHQF